MDATRTRKSYHIWTIGCQMNEADSRQLATQLERLGLDPITDIEAADVVVLNTCVVKQQAEDKIYGRLGSLKTIKEQRPGLTIGLMGCLVGIKEAPALRKRFPFVDVFMPPSDPAPLISHLREQDWVREIVASEQAERAQIEALQDQVEDWALPIETRGKAITAHVPIVLGCSHACTFCIIPYRRGKERSRPAAEVVSEVRALVAQGIKEVMLLGQIVDRYGKDMPEGPDLAGLLAQVHAVPGLERLRFLTSHPSYFNDRLLDAIASLPRLCPHIEIPVQAGNDEVLERMRRGYTVAEYRTLIARIRARLPHAAINTDLIVGFPGETVAQFEDTLALVAEMRFDKIHLSSYSERPRTVAARSLPDDVTAEEKARRWHAVDLLQRGIMAEKNLAYHDREVEVLVEEQVKERWRGRTPDNRLVFFADARPLAGQTVAVRIQQTSPYSLVGVAVS